MKHVLLIYTDFETLPEAFLIPESMQTMYDAAVRADGLMVNANDEDYNPQIVNFVNDVGDCVYRLHNPEETTVEKHPLLAEHHWNVMKEYMTAFNVDDKLTISRCGFIP